MQSDSAPRDIKKKVTIEMTEDCIILQPGDNKYKYCLVFLHGINMNIQKFFYVFLSRELIGIMDDFKVVIPQAPKRVMTVSKGKTEYSWYDFKERNFDKPFAENFNCEHIKESGEFITSILNREVELLDNDWSKIFLGGFSQGCAMSLYVGVPFPHKLGGVFNIAGYFMEITPEATVDQDLLVIHGDNDDVRPWKQVQPTYKRIEGKETCKFVLIKGMRHDLYNDEVKKLVYQFLRERAKL